MSIRWLLMALVMLLTTTIQARETIYWVQYDMRPFYIRDGQFAGQGINEIADQMIRDELPEYDHKIIWGNVARIVTMLKSGQPIVCSSMLRSPEREAMFLFSKEYRRVSVAQQLVIAARRASEFSPYLGADGAIDLEKLLIDNKFSGVFPVGRSYGNPIDTLLKKYEANYANRVQANYSMYDPMRTILKQLNSGRKDFTIAYPTEINYELKTGFPDDGPNTLAHAESAVDRNAPPFFLFLPIHGLPEFIPSYIAAPKTPWGEKVMADIDAVLPRLRFTPAFIQPIFDWNEGDARQRLQEYYRKQAVTDNRAK